MHLTILAFVAKIQAMPAIFASIHEHLCTFFLWTNSNQNFAKQQHGYKLLFLVMAI
jgi:hypothetical protein